MNLNSNVFIFSIVWFMIPVLLQPFMWHIVKMATQTNLQKYFSKGTFPAGKNVVVKPMKDKTHKI